MSDIAVDHAIVASVMPAMFQVVDELRGGCSDPELMDRTERLALFWKEAKPVLAQPSSACSVVVNQILPQVYVAIDDLLDQSTDIPKGLRIRAKRLLPNWAPHSFEQSA